MISEQIDYIKPVCDGTTLVYLNSNELSRTGVFEADMKLCNFFHLTVKGTELLTDYGWKQYPIMMIPGDTFSWFAEVQCVVVNDKPAVRLKWTIFIPSEQEVENMRGSIEVMFQGVLGAYRMGVLF